MYTLAYPIILPEGHGFHDDPRAIAPLLEGGLRLTCRKFSLNEAQILLVEGFDDANTAVQFSNSFGAALRCASLSLTHGFNLHGGPAVIDHEGIYYDGHVPTVYPTGSGAKPIFATARVANIDHIIGLAEQLNHELRDGTAKRLDHWPELAVSVRLFSEVDFAGGETARFVVLFSALEVLVQKARGGKRTHVQRLVRNTLTSADRPGRKSMCADLDMLYDVRNGLLHEAKPATAGDVKRLREIVRETLRILVDRQVTDQAQRRGCDETSGLVRGPFYRAF